MDNIFIYDIKEKNNFINEGKVGILLNSDNEVNIIDIPVSINDPLQMKIIEEQIASIIHKKTSKKINMKMNSLTRKRWFRNLIKG